MEIPVSVSLPCFPYIFLAVCQQKRKMIANSRGASWYSKIWSSWWGGGPVPRDSSNSQRARAQTASVATTVVFDQPNQEEEAPRESFVRKSAVRSARKRGRKTRIAISVIPAKQVTIFELYHPWRGQTIQQMLSTLDTETFILFSQTVHGDTLKLEEYLARMDLTKTETWMRSGGINRSDPFGRTALHFACSFGHVETAKLLLQEGANPNSPDQSGYITPLVCAAVNGNEEVINLLVFHGANVNRGLENLEGIPTFNNMFDEDEAECHTALAWAVKAGNVKSVKCLLEKGARLSGTTINWETPLHEAAYTGNVTILSMLLQSEKSPCEIDLRGGRDQNTAMHIAVQQGHIECVEVLLFMGAGPNKENIHGQTCLHLASGNNDFQIMQLLIRFGAEVNMTDTRSRAPLHYCIQSYTSGPEVTECIELLLSHGADLNAQDENGFTPFNTAVTKGASAIVPILLKHGADLTLRNNSGQSGVEILVKKMPHALRHIREGLDFAIGTRGKDETDPDYTVSLDFRPIIVSNWEGKNQKPRKEMDLLVAFCNFGHGEILSHPLIEAFLLLKWARLRKYFWASFYANLIMVLTYSMFIFRLYATKCPLHENWPPENCSEPTLKALVRVNLDLTYLITLWSLLLIMILVFMVKEFLQLACSPRSYFTISENYLQMIFVVSALMCIFKEPFGPVNFTEGHLCSGLCRRGVLYYSVAAGSIVIAWLLILVRLGKLPKLGLYVQMLFKVVCNFGMFIITYSSIVIAFALCFGILLDDEQGFNSIFHSVLSTLVWMTGELEMDVAKRHTQIDSPLYFVTYILITCFVLFVTIVTMNLLLGLAVSDIQGLKAGAKVARLKRLIVAISQLESTLFSNALAKILPEKLVERIRTEASLVSNEKMYSFEFRPHDPRDKTLPGTLKSEAVQILENRENERICSIMRYNNETAFKLDTVLERLERLESTLTGARTTENLNVPKAPLTPTIILSSVSGKS